METIVHTLKVSDDSRIVITSQWNGNVCVNILVDGTFPNYEVEEMITYALLEGGEKVGAILGVCDDGDEWYWADDGHRTNEDADITYTIESIEYK